jgi:hypothetical protein
MRHARFLCKSLAIAVLASPLLSAGPAQAASRAANPQVFAGTVVTAAGTPVARQKVNLYVTPDAAGKSVLIGSAVTGSDGRWSLPAPAYAALPNAAQQAAATDMGYLNVDAVALSGSSVAVAVESAWVGTPSLATESSSNTPLAMMMKLTASTASQKAADSCCGRFGCGPPLVQKVLGRSHAYTVVGEYHAYWNASGGLSYTRGATSSIGDALSVSDGPWTFGGYDSFSTSRSLTMGFPSNGSHNSHRMVVSLSYIKRRYVEESVSSGRVCHRWRQIDENGLYDPGHGWTLFKRGLSVIKDDGKSRYDYTNRHHPRYIDTVQAGGAFTLDVGQAYTYGAAASVMGASIQAETTHSSDVAQAYSAGNSTFRRHHVWGSDGNLKDNPKIEYSY